MTAFHRRQKYLRYIQHLVLQILESFYQCKKSNYQREGFIIQCEDLDEDTGEKEYTMLWKRK